MRNFTIGLMAAAALGIASTVVNAADMPVKAPPRVAAQSFSWTGCYVGVNAGGAWARNSYSSIPGIAVGSHTADGVAAGGQIGCNYQAGPWVWGVEGMFDWADLDGSHTLTVIPAVTSTTNVDWFATATGRIGYAVFDRTLFYVKGGGAWIRQTESLTALGVTLNDGGHTRGGWTVGAGLEYAFAGPWSAKLEYNYMDFGNRGTSVCGVICVPTGLNDREHVHAVLVGLNYRFSGLPGSSSFPR
jgi:outer membrane immunogenic protein